MMLEIDQTFRGIQISYLDENGYKAMMNLPLPYGGYRNWQVDPNGVGTQGFQHYNGAPVVHVPSKRYNRFDLLSFLFSQPKEIQDKLFAYKKANLITVDIETAIGDRFPDPQKAEQEILLITAIDQEMNIIVYTIKKGVQEVIDKVYDIIVGHVGHLIPPHLMDGLKQKIRVFEYDSEKVMIEQFLSNIVARAAIVSFWNGDGFDWPYIANRCKNLGINPALASITGGVKTWKENRPKHTIINDYMLTVRDYGVTIYGRESLSLDYISHRVLNVGKLPKVASLKEMSENPEFLAEFVAYNIVDTLNMQLIHIKMNLLDVLYAWAEVNYLPLDKVESQVAQLESMVCLDVITHMNPERAEGSPEYVAAFAEKRPDFVFWLNDIPVNAPWGLSYQNQPLYFKADGKTYIKNPNKKKDFFEVTIDMLEEIGYVNIQNEWRAFHQQHKYTRPFYKIAGGYVKDPDPWQPHKQWLACVDFSGQYPACHRSFKISVDNIVGHVGDFTADQIETMLETGHYMITFEGNIYDMSKDGIYKRRQEWLRKMRDVHKDKMNYHFHIQQPFIEAELRRRIWEDGPWKGHPVWHLDVTTPTDEAVEEYSHHLIDGIMLHEGINLQDRDVLASLDLGQLWHLFHTNLGHGFYNSNMQIAYKLEANSLYGATDHEANSFGDSRVSSDTTSSGRNTITCAEQLVNNYVAFEFQHDLVAQQLLYDTFGPDQFDWPTNIKLDQSSKRQRSTEEVLEHMKSFGIDIENAEEVEEYHKLHPNPIIRLNSDGNVARIDEPFNPVGNVKPIPYRDRVAYIDTDSLYIEFGDMATAMGFKGDFVEFFVTLYTKHLGKIVNSRLAEMINARGGDSMIKFDLELICTDAIFTKKKKYILAVAYMDGRRFPEPWKNLIVKGMDMKQNAISPKAKGLIGRMLEMLLTGEIKKGDKAAYIEYMVDAWDQFKNFDLDDIAKRSNIKRDMYEEKVLECSYANDKVVFAQRTLPPTRGAAFFNYHLEKHGLMGEIEPLMDGPVLYYEDVNNCSFSYRLMEDLPFEKPECNKLLMFNKLVVMAIDRFAYAFDVKTDLKPYLGIDSSDLSDDDDDED